MRRGKISENIIQRSVLKAIKYKDREYFCTHSSIGNDATVTRKSESVISVANAGLMFEFENWTDNPLFYFDIKRGFHAALNNVLAEGGMPKGVIVDLILPHKAIEQDIKKIMGFIGGLAKDARVEITGGDTEVTVNVLSPVVVITAIGGRMEATGEVNIHADMDIVMAGYAGVSGSVAAAYMNSGYINERFSRSYSELIFGQQEYMDISGAAVNAWKYGVRTMHDVGRGGVYAALFELSLKTGFGVKAELGDIPIHQETVEVCELFDLNPYKLMSDGGLLMVAENGDDLCECLSGKGIEAVNIGKLTNNQEKAIVKNDETGFIEAPRGDELYKLSGK